jgi:hypothetical protein
VEANITYNISETCVLQYQFVGDSQTGEGGQGFLEDTDMRNHKILVMLCQLQFQRGKSHR